MLSETCAKRHLIKIPPFPKRILCFFGGGVSLFEKFDEVLVLSQQKNSGKNFEQTRNQPILANSNHFMIF
jgi:hypothetical protein